jgi:outer membrane protein
MTERQRAARCADLRRLLPPLPGARGASGFEQADAELSSVEQKVALEVWQAYQTLQTRPGQHQKLLGYASKSLEVAQGRFKAGVGSTLELLEAQRAMADAAQQRINALATWRATRLRLAASLGRLGFWSVAGT